MGGCVGDLVLGLAAEGAVEGIRRRARLRGRYCGRHDERHGHAHDRHGARSHSYRCRPLARRVSALLRW